jgi:serine/threonine protein kinase
MSSFNTPSPPGSGILASAAGHGTLAQCPPKERLAAFVSGRLVRSEVEPLLSHLSGCTSCGATLAEFERDTDSVIAALRQSYSDMAPLTESAFVAARGRIAAGIPAASGERQLLESPPSPPTPPRRVGHYELLEKLGQGGMGEVYRALHTNLQKMVALKLLPEGRLRDEDALRRFKQEMAAVGKLDHPHIVRAFDAGQADGQHYLVMEYVEGIDLSRLARLHGPLPIADACEIIRQAAMGLAHAHEHGLVHRDIKPGNLMLAIGSRLSAIGGRLWEVGREQLADNQPPIADSSQPIADSRKPTADSCCVKILDFGLARLRGGKPDGELTRQSQIMGTLDYMAPEQAASSRDVDIRADIYSLGATLYKLLCGRAPFDSRDYDSPVELLTAQITKPIPPIEERRVGIPPALASIVARMLSKDPNDRPATPAAVEQLLAPLTAGSDLGALISVVAGRRSSPASADLATLSTDAFLAQPKTETFARPSSAALPQKAARERKRWSAQGRWIAAGIAGVLLLLAAVVVVATDRGTVEIRVPDDFADSVEVHVRRGGELIEIIDVTTNTRVTLRSGIYELRLAGRKDNVLRLKTDHFQLHRGENVIAEVERRGPPPPPPPRPPIDISALPKMDPSRPAPPEGATGVVHLYHPVNGHFLTAKGDSEVVVTIDPRGSPEAAWTWTSYGDGVTFRNVATGTYLQSKPDQSGVSLAPEDNDDPTLWRMKVTNGRVALQNVSSRGYLGSRFKGELTLGPGEDFWMFTDVAKTARDQPIHEALPPVGTFGSNSIHHVQTGKYLSGAGGQLRLSTSGSARNAHWIWRRMDNGFHIQLASTLELLDVDGNTPGGPILYNSLRSVRQLWELRARQPGHYTLRSAHQGRYLAVDSDGRLTLLENEADESALWQFQEFSRDGE